MWDFYDNKLLLARQQLLDRQNKINLFAGSVNTRSNYVLMRNQLSCYLTPHNDTPANIINTTQHATLTLHSLVVQDRADQDDYVVLLVGVEEHPVAGVEEHSKHGPVLPHLGGHDVSAEI